MTNINDPRAVLRNQQKDLHERLDELRAATTYDQTDEYVREVLVDLRRLAKACERASTNMIESFSAEIRDLKLANETLQAKGTLHEAVFENSNDGIVITTRGGDFLDVNQGFVRLVGCKTKEEVFARKIQDFYVDPRQRTQMRRKVDRTWSAMNFEIKFRRIDGSEIDTLHTIDVRLDGEGRVSGYQGIMRDITERKLAQKALQEARDELQTRVNERTSELADANTRLKSEIAERARAQEALILSEERLRAIFEAATECVSIKDRSLKYTLVNPYMANLLERPATQIIGRTDEELFGQEAGRHMSQVDQRVLLGETIEEEHTRPVRGLPTTFLDVHSPIRDSTEQIIGVCGISRNITDRSRISSLTEGTAEDYISPAMRLVLARASVAANADVIVLIEGESGSGKDYLARYIHNNSKRSGGPFYAINCAAIAEQLAESELFGHESGAFTGAVRRKRGLVELAEGGTLLLNEIGELSLPIQAKLLTFLDTFSFTRVGGEKSVTVNVRIMAATNRDLSQAVSMGEFRRDLFFRLNVYRIQVPPLRERAADIPILTRQLVSQLARELKLARELCIRPEDMEKLIQYSWPGNVRELKNVLERSVIISEGPDLRVDFLEFAEPIKSDGPLIMDFPPSQSLTSLIEELRRQFISLALERTGGNKCAAARILGISRYTLKRQMKSLRMGGPK
jgi:sigma-54 dependent transcriptional regulator, acetoin dehydrogenase operon transcriptional activator AcoR